MGKWTPERLAASSGIGFVILLVVGSLIPGSPKKYDASAADIATWFHDKHKSILIAGILFGLAYVFFLWFLASFAGTFRAAGEQRLATVIYGAGVAFVTIGAVSDGVMVALSREVSLGADANTIKLLYGVDSFLYSRMFWIATAIALATAIANSRAKAMPDWFGWLSSAGAIVFVIGGLSQKTAGFFSPSGGMVMITFIVFLAWVLVASFLLVQKTATATMGAPATSPL
ncbi:MAG: hypothetical protein ACYDA3_00320 [Gaiellaceae bacterium]